MTRFRYAALLFAVMLIAAALTNACSGTSGSTTNPSPNDSGANSTPTSFSVAISAANEVPGISNAESGVAGTATITLHAVKDGAGNVTSATADFQVNVSGLPASSTLTMAHIHRGGAGTTGGIVVDTGLSTQSPGVGSFTRSGISVSPDIAQGILNDASAFYFNVHSAMNAGGVARAQLAGSSSSGGGASSGSSGGSSDGY
ncbi:MAG: CHRD domain-containing protein [Vicinamibacterales bacterium]